MNTQKDIKLCKDCRFSKKGRGFYKCYRPIKSFHYYYGNYEEPVDSKCVSERVFECGHEAKYFEPRVSWLTKVKNWLGVK